MQKILKINKILKKYLIILIWVYVVVEKIIQIFQKKI